MFKSEKTVIWLGKEQFREDPAGKMLDCPMGAMVSTVEKLLITQEFYTEGYGQLAACESCEIHMVKTCQNKVWQKGRDVAGFCLTSQGISDLFMFLFADAGHGLVFFAVCL